MRNAEEEGGLRRKTEKNGTGEWIGERRNAGGSGEFTTECTEGHGGRLGEERRHWALGTGH
jgi:hypothetical protein